MFLYSYIYYNAHVFGLVGVLLGLAGCQANYRGNSGKGMD